MKKLLSSLDEGTQKLVLIFIRILIVLFVLIIFFIIISSCSNKKGNHSKLENVILDATQKYYNAKENELPQEIGSSKKITISELISSEYMKPVTNYIDDTTCDGYTLVTKTASDYQYNVVLTCQDYKTNTLDKAIMKDLTESEDGLYAGIDEYYYRGNILNNYVQIGKTLFRIISIDTDNKVKLIKEESNRYSTIWDDRYNNDTNNEKSGINQLSRSYIIEELNNEFNEEDDVIIKNYALLHDWCSSKVDESKAEIKKPECDSTAKSYYGIINLYEYARASIDENCNTLFSGSCKNYNFINDIFQEPNFTLSVVSDNSYEVYTVYSYGLTRNEVARTSKITEVMYINGENTISSGDGSKENPYILK